MSASSMSVFPDLLWKGKRDDRLSLVYPQLWICCFRCLTTFINPTATSARSHGSLQSTNEEMEAQRAQVICLRSHSLSGLDLSGWKIGVSFLYNTFPPPPGLRIPLTDFQDGFDFCAFFLTVGEDTGWRKICVWSHIHGEVGSHEPLLLLSRSAW